MQKFMGIRVRLPVAAIIVAAIAGGAAIAAPAQAEDEADRLAALTPAAVATIKRIESSPAFAKAMAAIDSGHDKWVADIITLTEIPAPPFKETARAKAYRDIFIAQGLTDVEIDAVGNVTGLRKGGGEGLIIVSAHLDTVFPEGTPVKVRREGDKLFAPGVGDDSTGLATQLAFINAMNAAGIRTKADILFVGTVGEEGRGDLRGVRHLFTKGKYQGRTKAFFSIDGGGMDSLTIGGAGSKRYRVTFKGPGGHSYGAFGMPNPLHAMGRAIAKIAELEASTNPKVTFNVGLVSGGTSVNSISAEGVMDIDLRSESAAALADIDARLQTALRQALAEEKARWPKSTVPLALVIDTTGLRPAGTTADTSFIVRTSLAAARTMNVYAPLTISSTDANIPISKGIAAVTLDGGGVGRGAHSLDESYDDRTDGYKGPQWILLVVIGLLTTR